MTDIRLEKKAVREKYRAIRDGIPASERKKFDEAICDRFISLSSYRLCDVILLYSAANSEPDLSAVFEDAIKRGKKVAFPVSYPDGIMEYRFVSSKDQLKEGAFGIKEPSKDLELFDKNARYNCVCVTPALVFDKRGYRLGYGRGYYDRYLEDFRGARIGVCYSPLVADRIPTGRYDLKIDTLITEKGVMSFAKN